MEIHYPVYSNPIRITIIIPEIILGENENEYVVYEWGGAEMAEIQNLYNQSLEPTIKTSGIWWLPIENKSSPVKIYGGSV